MKVVGNRCLARTLWLIALLTLMPLAWAEEVVRYMHTDALGSVVVVTDQNRNVVERMEYEPYGQQLASLSREGVGYAGHVQDRGAGLVYMQQRYYDPDLGRFLSVDPVTTSPKSGTNFNRYAYVSNNPFTFKDPDGRYECIASKDQCAAVASAVRDIASAAHSSVSGGTRIPRISRFLGRENERNGVVIMAGGGKSLGSARTEYGSTTLRVNFQELGSTDEVSSVVTHEASHGLDQRSRDNQGLDPMTVSRTDLNISELNANLAEGHLFRALGRDSPYGMWTVEGGVNHDKINLDADRSVNSVCSEVRCEP